MDLARNHLRAQGAKVCTDLNVRFGSDDSGIPNTVRISRDARGDQQILGRVAAIEGGLDHACGLDDFVDGNRPHAAVIKQVTGHRQQALLDIGELRRPTAGSPAAHPV